jgi:cyclophilin family peptidyl-prolyl cis-trans isomerase
MRCCLSIVLSLAVGLPNTSFAQSPAKGPNPIVVIDTSMGKIKLELFPDKAPVTVQSFLSWAEKKHYDGTMVHQVTTFWIHAGEIEPPPSLKRRKTDPIKSESENGLSNVRGTIALTQVGAGDPSGGVMAAFFINLKNNRFLDRANAKDGIGQCVFGKVIEGMDVVDKIAAVPTKRLGKLELIPEENIIIKSVRKIN